MATMSQPYRNPGMMGMGQSPRMPGALPASGRPQFPPMADIASTRSQRPTLPPMPSAPGLMQPRRVGPTGLPAQPSNPVGRPPAFDVMPPTLG